MSSQAFLHALSDAAQYVASAPPKIAHDRITPMKQEAHRCACSFAKAVGDNDPTHFPRVGMSENVLLRGHWIIKHSESGRTSVIRREGPALHAEADTCCFGYFVAKTVKDLTP
jgi:hypothetical protein